MIPSLSARRSGMPCRARTPALALAALLAVVGGSVGAQPTPPAAPSQAQPPSFLIEELRIEGTERGSEAVVRAESRLRTGASYTEDELRDAVVRIHRLPFVLTTEFRLEKGSVRGAYVLVIRVFETHRLFYSVERRYTDVDEPVVLEGKEAVDDTRSARATGGYRFRIGAYGEGVLAADTAQGLQAGYTHYDLFGRGAALSLAVSRDYDSSTVLLPLGLDPRYSGWQVERAEIASGRLAVPLAGNHGLLLRGEWLHSEDGFERRVLGRSRFAARLNERSRIDLVESGISWIWDDSDDPIAPRSGRTFELGIEALSIDAEGDSAFLFNSQQPPSVLEPTLARYDGRLVRLAGRAAHHVPLGPSTSVSWSARAAAGEGRLSGLPLTVLDPNGQAIDAGTLDDPSYQVVEASAGVILRRRLWQPAESFVTLWLEGVGDVSYQTVDLDLPGIDGSVTQTQAGIRLTLRDSWGVLRAGLYLVALEGGGP